MTECMFRLEMARFLDLMWGPQLHDHALGSKSQGDGSTNIKTPVRATCSSVPIHGCDTWRMNFIGKLPLEVQHKSTS